MEEVSEIKSKEFGSSITEEKRPVQQTSVKLSELRESNPAMTTKARRSQGTTKEDKVVFILNYL